MTLGTKLRILWLVGGIRDEHIRAINIERAGDIRTDIYVNRRSCERQTGFRQKIKRTPTIAQVDFLLRLHIIRRGEHTPDSRVVDEADTQTVVKRRRSGHRERGVSRDREDKLDIEVAGVNHVRIVRRECLVSHHIETEIINIGRDRIAVTVFIALGINDHHVAAGFFRPTDAVAQIKRHRINPVPVKRKTADGLNSRSEIGMLDPRAINTLIAKYVRIIDTLQFNRQREIERNLHRLSRKRRHLAIRSDQTHCV